MNNVRPIRNDAQRQAAVKRMRELYLLDPIQGSSEADELEMWELVMQRHDQESREEWPCNAVEAIQFHMAQKGLSKKDLEPYIGSSARVSEILSGKRNLTLAMIKALHAGLKIPAASLLSDAEPSNSEGIPSFEWTKYPLVEMCQRGFFGDTHLSAAQLKSRASELVGGFLRSAQHMPQSHALLRSPLHQSGSRTIDEPSLLVWRIRVIQKSRMAKLRGKYESGLINQTWLRNLAKLSTFDTGPKLAQEHLSRYGISLVFECHFSKTYLDGAAMLDGDNPIIGLTLRHNRVDNFWFALLHELAHVGHHLKPECRFIADNLEDKTRAEEEIEKEADQMAQEALIPKELWENAKVRKTLALADALELAETAEIHPAIVAGRIRHETGNWRLLATLIKHAGTVNHHFEDQL